MPVRLVDLVREWARRRGLYWVLAPLSLVALEQPKGWMMTCAVWNVGIDLEIAEGSLG